MNQRVKKLLKRLRSGKWHGITGCFTEGEDRYCILGAITKEYELQTGKQMYHSDTHAYVGGDQEELLPDVAEYFGFKSVDPAVIYLGGVNNLVDINDDSELTLVEMANLIEENEKQLFKKPKVTKKPKKVKPVEKTQTLEQYMGTPFIDAHIEAQKRRQLQLQK